MTKKKLINSISQEKGFILMMSVMSSKPFLIK